MVIGILNAHHRSLFKWAISQVSFQMAHLKRDLDFLGYKSESYMLTTGHETQHGNRNGNQNHECITGLFSNGSCHKKYEHWALTTLRIHDSDLWVMPTWVVSLFHTARRCNTLQHTATHCNTLQPTWVVPTWVVSLNDTTQSCVFLRWIQLRGVSLYDLTSQSCVFIWSIDAYMRYRVAKTHEIPYPYRSFSAKVTYI